MSRFGEHRLVTVMALVICSACGRTEASAAHAARETGTLRADPARCAKESSHTGTTREKCTRRVFGTTEDGRAVTVYTEDTESCDRAPMVALARNAR